MCVQTAYMNVTLTNSLKIMWTMLLLPTLLSRNKPDVIKIYRTI